MKQIEDVAWSYSIGFHRAFELKTNLCLLKMSVHKIYSVLRFQNRRVANKPELFWGAHTRWRCGSGPSRSIGTLRWCFSGLPLLPTTQAQLAHLRKGPTNLFTPNGSAARSFLARELSYDLYGANQAQKTLPPGKIRPVRAPFLRGEAQAVSPEPPTSSEFSPPSGKEVGSAGGQHRAVLFRKEECERLQKEVLPDPEPTRKTSFVKWEPA